MIIRCQDAGRFDTSYCKPAEVVSCTSTVTIVFLEVWPHYHSCLIILGRKQPWACQPISSPINSSPPGENGRYFTDDIFRGNFVIERFCILIKISLKFVPKVPIDNNPPLVEIMALP